MKTKYKITLLVIGILLLITLYITQSYALWVIKSEQGTANQVYTGCFSVGYTNGNSISLTNTYPVADATALANANTLHTFTITNTCTIPANYTISLNTLSSTTINENLVKFAFYQSTANKPGTGTVLGTYTKNTDTASLGISNLKNSYKLATGSLTAGTASATGTLAANGESKTFNLYLWISSDGSADSTSSNYVAGKRLDAQIAVYATPA